MTPEATQQTKTGGQPAVITLRPYQKEMLREVWRPSSAASASCRPISRRAAWRRVQPTGAGKTVEILTLVNQLAKDMKWREPLLVVPTLKLIRQTASPTLQKFYPALEVGSRSPKGNGTSRNHTPSSLPLLSSRETLSGRKKPAGGARRLAGRRGLTGRPKNEIQKMTSGQVSRSDQAPLQLCNRERKLIRVKPIMQFNNLRRNKNNRANKSTTFIRNYNRIGFYIQPDLVRFFSRGD